MPASVPLVVIGDPDTEIIDGSVSATDVTVPVPYGKAGRSAVVSALNVGTAPAPDAGPAKRTFAA